METIIEDKERSKQGHFGSVKNNQLIFMEELQPKTQPQVFDHNSILILCDLYLALRFFGTYLE